MLSKEARVLMLLLMNDGKTYEEIAAFLGCSRRTVVYWCVHGDPDKLESLQDRRKIGNYRKATPVYIKLLLETIEKEPSELGYEFGRWTGDRLATYLAEKTGIQLTGSQVRKILKEKKYVYLWVKSAGQNPLSGELHAKYSLEDKQNPILRREFREKLSRYIEVAKIYPNLVQVWFWDESGFSLRVVRRKT